jgi:hypothetical protein
VEVLAEWHADEAVDLVAVGIEQHDGGDAEDPQCRGGAGTGIDIASGEPHIGGLACGVVEDGVERLAWSAPWCPEVGHRSAALGAGFERLIVEVDHHRRAA